MNFKKILWKLGLYPELKCPICQGELLRVGFPDPIDGEQYYKCRKDSCKFNG